MRKSNNPKRKTRGFTLVELGIAIAIISVLSGSVMVGKGLIGTARLSSTIKNVNNIRNAMRTYVTMRNGNFRNGYDTENRIRDFHQRLTEANLLGDIENDGAPAITSVFIRDSPQKKFVGIVLDVDYLRANDMQDELYAAFSEDPMYYDQLMPPRCRKPQSENFALCFKFDW